MKPSVESKTCGGFTKSITVASVPMEFYLVPAAFVLLRALYVFFKDESTPKTHLYSWVMIFVASALWPITLPSILCRLLNGPANNDNNENLYHQEGDDREHRNHQNHSNSTRRPKVQHHQFQHRRRHQRNQWFQTQYGYLTRFKSPQRKRPNSKKIRRESTTTVL